MDEQVEHFETDGNTIETAEELSAREGIYGAIKRALIARGIPADEIAFIHDFKTPKKKAEAFAAANAGRIRVMLASTEKAGTGVNMQERLYALHHLDTPWRPSDIEQREGRILRQGNRFPAVHVCTYVTENSFDGYMWQTLESKARFISQIMAGEVTARTADDVDQLVMTAAQIKAIASGNPQILEKVALEVELTKLERLYSVWLSNRRRMQFEADRLPDDIARALRFTEWQQRALKVRDDVEAAKGRADDFRIALRQKLETDKQAEFADRKRAGAQLQQLAFAVARQAQRVGRLQVAVGAYQGFTICLQAQRPLAERDLLNQLPELWLRLDETGLGLECKLGDSDLGVIQSMDAQLRSLEHRLAQAEQQQRRVEHRYEQVQQELNKGWEHATRYEELRAKLLAVNVALTAAGQEIEASPELAQLDEEALQPVPEKVSLHQLTGLSVIENSAPESAAAGIVETPGNDVFVVASAMAEVEVASDELVRNGKHEEAVELRAAPLFVHANGKVKSGKRVGAAQMQFDWV